MATTHKDIVAFAHKMSEMCRAWRQDANEEDTAFAKMGEDEQRQVIDELRNVALFLTAFCDGISNSQGDLIGATAEREHLINLLTATDPDLVTNAVFLELVSGFMRRFGDNVDMVPRRWYDAYQEYDLETPNLVMLPHGPEAGEKPN